MSDAINREVYDRLTVEQKMQLAGDIWADADRMCDGIPLTPEQAEVAEQRLREHEANPTDVVTWDEMLRRVRGEK